MWENNTVEDQIQRNSLEYGVSVNTDRSIPDAKSGLKPVARRIIYDAYINGYLAGKPHVKCARIYGDVMGRFHPHGDSSIYGAMIRLSQDWVLRYPLIDVHGNNGTILGDGPAAGRYTEARLSPIAEEGLLQGLKKKNVDFIPNYDESEEEPLTLPAIFPNLLCNPNEGIGWAMGCNWAPHNLIEVRDAILQFLKGEEPMLPGPDFPTGGIIINKDDIPAIMRSGHGSVKIRGRYRIEGQNIIFYELPYGTRLEPLMEEIGAACEAGKVNNVTDVRNETGNKSGLKLVIQVERNANIMTVVNQLFDKTDLQTTFSYNQIALISKTPVELTLKDAIDVYVKHNIECIIREAKFDLNKAEARQEVVQGLLRALEDIDNIIQLIKSSESAAAAKENLIAKYEFSEAQAKAIIDMKLGKLANLEKIELEKENSDLLNTINELNTLINSKSVQKKELIKRLNAIVNKYGDARRTDLTQLSTNKEEKIIESVVAEEVVVLIDDNGIAKRVPQSSIKTQRRGARGTKNSDSVRFTVETNTQDYLLIFTSAGKMYRTLVDNINSDGKNGVYLGDLVKMSPRERIVAVTSLEYKSQPKYIIFFTKQGMVKKTDMGEYLIAKKNGLIAMKLREGDSIVSIAYSNGKEELMMFSHFGKAIKFDNKFIPITSRATMGVKGIKLDQGDYVIAGLPEEKDKVIITISRKGMGKQMEFEEFVDQMYGGKGVYYYNLKDDEPAAVISAARDAKIIVVSKDHSLCLTTADFPSLHRAATGNVMIKNASVLSMVAF